MGLDRQGIEKETPLPLDRNSINGDHVKTDVSTPTPPEDFSLVLGGPLYQMYLRSRLARPPMDLPERRVIAFIVVTWLPLLGLTLAGGTALSGVTVPFLFDLDVHIRFLLALPLLIGAELIVHQRLRVTVRQFIDRGIVAPEDRLRFDGIIAAAMRLRNSAAVEIALIVAAITVGYWVWRESMSLHVGSWYVAVGPAGDEQPHGGGLVVCLCQPQSVPLRASTLVFSPDHLVRLPVAGVAAAAAAESPAPGPGGRTGFHRKQRARFTPVLVAHTVVLAGLIGSRIWYEGMKLPAFQIEIVGAVALLMAIVLAPLTFFGLKLAGAKRDGVARVRPAGDAVRR